ncbi:low affinity Fe/Cu permease [Elusimicrobium simillimum]|uniref:hypothetical protein n=1 Tax=Elusimicrobium simillimum TaxID=3143438 RepID=UPI003C6EECC2
MKLALYRIIIGLFVFIVVASAYGCYVSGVRDEAKAEQAYLDELKRKQSEPRRRVVAVEVPQNETPRSTFDYVEKRPAVKK